ncbi:DUF2946 domain-containing protein [Roseateles sp. SL47]|uniref:DUF2946 domain-containing protein n=1 Tax=Roseateles sp. SL47 TaxID=2995138 RepID=UPI00226F185C|nr:DUF2946 domain-containing protein [Roseateles sp. SL47]WAC71703.1 DUF2946 domain-containing protein [Roseateles sp. SL47]
MLQQRRFKAFTAWVASLVILWSALAPSLSYAFVSDVPGGWIEICSVTGAKLVPAQAASYGADAAVSGSFKSDTSKPDSSKPDTSKSSALKSCTYCSSHVQVLGLPPAPAAGLTLEALAYHLPELFLAGVRTLFAWASVQARAPPLSP